MSDLFGNPENIFLMTCIIYEPCCEKTGLRGLRPGPTQIDCAAAGDGLESRGTVLSV